jgi:hypothetical protein
MASYREISRFISSISISTCLDFSIVCRTLIHILASSARLLLGCSFRSLWKRAMAFLNSFLWFFGWE